MKTKILFPILVICLLVICGCGKSEQLATDIAATPSVTTEPIVATVPANEEIESEKSAELQEPSSASETVEPPTVPKNADERMEETVPAREVELQVVETQPSETMTSSETIPALTEPAVIDTSANVPSVSETTEKPSIEEKPVPQETVPPATEAPMPEPPVTEPPATESASTETVPPKEPQPTEPPAQTVDTADLEAYGRSYASDKYGYNGTAECTPETEAGCFPSSTQTITSKEEGERIIQEAINNLKKNDDAHGYAAYEEVDGETVRCPVNVEVTPTGEPNEYTITVYYGGTA